MDYTFLQGSWQLGAVFCHTTFAADCEALLIQLRTALNLNTGKFEYCYLGGCYFRFFCDIEERFAGEHLVSDHFIPSKGAVHE